jgi:hypothetical protein
MLRIGDFVQHKQTELTGVVIGYGHQIIDDIYLPTLVVHLDRNQKIGCKGIMEDLSSLWQPVKVRELQSHAA